MNDVVEPIVVERLRNQFYTCAVDRGVDNLEVVIFFVYLRAERKLLDCIEIILVHLVSDDLDQFGIAFEFNVGDALDAVHMIYDVDIVRSNDLRTVGPVCLVAVVFFRIV